MVDMEQDKKVGGGGINQTNAQETKNTAFNKADYENSTYKRCLEKVQP